MSIPAGRDLFVLAYEFAQNKTDAWTDAMGQAVAPKEYDGETGQAISTGAPLTAEQYLAENAFAPKTIQVNTKTSSFDFDGFGVKTGFQN